MTEKEDRILPLLFEELSEEEIAYWKKKEPWNYLPSTKKGEEPLEIDDDKTSPL